MIMYLLLTEGIFSFACAPDVGFLQEGGRGRFHLEITQLPLSETWSVGSYYQKNI